jgi:hypothetical protein
VLNVRSLKEGVLSGLSVKTQGTNRSRDKKETRKQAIGGENSEISENSKGVKVGENCRSRFA